MPSNAAKCAKKADVLCMQTPPPQNNNDDDDGDDSDDEN